MISIKQSSARLGAAFLAVAMVAGCASRPSRVAESGGYSSGAYASGGYASGGYASGGYDAGYRGQGRGNRAESSGTIESIDMVRSGSQTSGGGALLGGAVGALAGHQIDHGNHKAAATLFGAVAGALIGNQVEKQRSGAQDVYRVSVRFDNGAQRSFDYAQLGDIRVGDRVRVDGDQVYRN